MMSWKSQVEGITSGLFVLECAQQRIHEGQTAHQTHWEQLPSILLLFKIPLYKTSWLAHSPKTPRKLE